MTWTRITEPATRRTLLTAALGRVFAARAVAERREIAVQALDSGEIWQSADGAVTIWALPGATEVVLADFLPRRRRCGASSGAPPQAN